MSRQGHSGVTFKDNPLIAIGAGKSVKNSSATPLASRSVSIADTRQVLASHSATYTVPANTGESLTLVSASASDTAVAVRVSGLDGDFKEHTETVILTGITPVAVPGTWTRVNELTVTSPAAPVGIVQIEGSAVFAEILPGVNRSRTGIYSAPAGYSMQVLDIVATMVRTQGNADASGIVYISYSLIVDIEDVWTNLAVIEAFSFGLQRRGNSVISLPVLIPVTTNGPIDVIYEGEADAAPAEMSIRTTVLLEQL